MLVWWGSPVECASAIARLERDTALDEIAAAQAFDRLTQIARGRHEVDAGDAVREAAVRFLRVHPLCAADALQLAAAFTAAAQRPSSLAFVTLDDRLATAARKGSWFCCRPTRAREVRRRAGPHLAGRGGRLASPPR